MQERPAQFGDSLLPLHLPHPAFLYDLTLRNCQADSTTFRARWPLLFQRDRRCAYTHLTLEKLSAVGAYCTTAQKCTKHNPQGR